MAHNEYDGHCVPATAAAGDLEVVDVASMDPKGFFDRYVAKRRPVVLRGLPEDLRRLEAWTNEYLAAKAGDAQVEVERRDAAAQAFGQGHKVRMPFRELLSELSQGSDRFYLTTQEVAVSELGRAEMVGEPLKQLLRACPDEFPLLPALLGNLVPSNINLWMGNSSEGTSTGLHHDYHDNLYVLLRGRKRFRLFSPADAHRMYTRGEMIKVHPNGRINYAGFPTRPDGAEVAQINGLAKARAELELERAEAAALSGEKGARERLKAAEARLDKVMDALLDASGEDGGGGFDDFDDFDDADSGDDGAEDSDEGGDGCGASSQRRPVAAGAPAGKRARTEAQDPRETPLNFSTVDDPDNANAKRYPLFAGARPIFARLHAGDMLYLPCGWFHEVTSSSSPAPGQDRPGHLAFNYWMHPPDARSFAAPYRDVFWSDLAAFESSKGDPTS